MSSPHTERIHAEIAIFSRRKWIHNWLFSYRFCQLNLQKSTWNYHLRIHCSMLWELRTLWNINGCFEAVNEHNIGQSSEATKLLELKAVWSGLRMYILPQIRFVLSNRDRPSGFVNHVRLNRVLHFYEFFHTKFTNWTYKPSKLQGKCFLKVK